MNKEQIFGMYLGQKIFIKQENLICKLDSIFTNQDSKFTIRGSTEYNNYKQDISDCQLVLKSISEVSEEDKINLSIGLFFSEHFIFLINEILANNYSISLSDSIAIINYLIEHGYALTDEWFNKGWAVKA